MSTWIAACLLALSFQGPVGPPGVRPSGAIPAFQAEPVPPAWVRLESHGLADPDCRHYGYEAYADGTHWLVRYVMFPEDREGFREIEQAFLLSREPGREKPRRLSPADLQVEPLGVRWKDRTFRLVDRRDLVRN